MSEKTDKFNALMAYIQADQRVCPKPMKWNMLWRILPNKTRSGSGWTPPAPLILSAWGHTTDFEKMARFREHIEYADDQGALDRVDRFIRKLEHDDWYISN